MNISHARIPISVPQAHRLINHGPVILVSSYHKRKSNIITLAWAMPGSHDPKLMCISVGKTRFSHGLIKESKEFAINVPTAEMKDVILGCGSVSGRKIDKFSKFGLTTITAQSVKVPLIGECAAHLECKVINDFPVGDHTVFTGEVMAASAVEDFLGENRAINLHKFPTLHHLGGKHFGILREY